MMKTLDKIFSLIDTLFVWACFIILGGMTFLISLQVFFRYVMNAPLAWTEELARFGFIWMTFFAGYLGARKAQHISVELIQDMFPKSVKKGMQFISYIIAAVFFFVVSYYLMSLWGRLARQVSPALKIHMNHIYLGILIGSIFMGVAYIYEALKAVFGDPNKTEKKEEIGGSVD
ncbi:MAG: TRAP transporter small permease [Synergistaceae bacterium]|nr:TRAP transporter small permease [Synergistaceae bacterium]MBR0252291.1 TRAP transporter small permease [Synergistaceae bacterium]